MPTFTCPNFGRSFVRCSVLMLAVAGTGYAAGALFQNPLSSRDVSAAFAAPAFARPAQRSQSDRDDSPAATDAIPPTPAELGRFDAQRIFEPRECDLPRGISTACLFMD
jgi:hypothetical protein